MKNLETLIKRKEEIDSKIKEHFRIFCQKGKTSPLPGEVEEYNKLIREQKNVEININQVKWQMFGKD